MDHGGARERLTVGRMTLQAQDDGASNLYWRLVRRHQVNRDWDKITGCESRSEEAGHGPEAQHDWAPVSAIAVMAVCATVGQLRLKA